MKTGHEFGKLSLRLVEKFDAKQIKGRTLMVVYVMISHWKQHLRESITHLKEGYKIGVETGDFEYGALCLHSYHQHLLYLGEQLDKLEGEFDSSSRALDALGQEIQLAYNRIFHQVILNLTGQGDDPTELNGEAFDTNVHLVQLNNAEDQIGCWLYHYAQNMLCCMFHNYEKGIIAATDMEQYSNRVGGTVAAARSRFWDSLCRLGRLRNGAKSQRRKYLKQIRANQKKFKHWAHHCPENYRHLYLLIEAERLSYRKKYKKAELLYEEAIAAAKEGGFLSDEAVGEELAGRHYSARGKTVRAQKHLRNARYNYLRWGATAKVEAMDAEYPALLPQN